MSDPSRRSLLLGGALALGAGLSGCSTPNLPLISLPDPDDEHRLSTAKSESNLIGLYSGVIAAHPGLAGKLKPIRTQHVEHLKAALGEIELTGDSSAPTPAKGDRAAALKQLVRAERSAARARTKASVATEDGNLARLIAQIGSSESSHQALLTRIKK